jgi:hypothetical protein
MTRTPQFAPSWLPRQQRRRVDRELQKLFCRDACSVCGSPFKHNSQTVGSFDAQGNVVLAGECCASRVALILGKGFYSAHRYDFLPHSLQFTGLTNEQVTAAIATGQKAIADTDHLADVEKRGGGGNGRVPYISVLDHPWKDDDRDWFKQNPSRSHRVRMPFPDEADKEAAEIPAGHTLIMLVRQVEPGKRLRTDLFINDELLPLPDNEAVAHALFEVAVQREPVPPNVETLNTLIEKYLASGTVS